MCNYAENLKPEPAKLLTNNGGGLADTPVCIYE